MKKQQDYTQDISEIRSMMERSSKFPSLSGWTGIMAGIYALAGAYIAYDFFHFRPDTVTYGFEELGRTSTGLQGVIVTAAIVCILAIATAVVLTNKKAAKDGEKVWNAASRQLLFNLAVPFIAGGLFIVILLSKGFIGLVIPLSLLFYGMALFSAAKFTYKEVKWLGMIEMGLGLFSAIAAEYSILFWAAGFGVFHILYGIYMYFKYER
jgi:hypothetical protein